MKLKLYLNECLKTPKLSIFLYDVMIFCFSVKLSNWIFQKLRWYNLCSVSNFLLPEYTQKEQIKLKSNPLDWFDLFQSSCKNCWLYTVSRRKYSAGHHDLHWSKTLISPSNVAQNANPGTVLETARPEDSKTPPTC